MKPKHLYYLTLSLLGATVIAGAINGFTPFSATASTITAITLIELTRRKAYKQ